jgi:hypothetical protein
VYIKVSYQTRKRIGSHDWNPWPRSKNYEDGIVSEKKVGGSKRLGKSGSGLSDKVGVAFISPRCIRFATLPPLIRQYELRNKVLDLSNILTVRGYRPYRHADSL